MAVLVGHAHPDRLATRAARRQIRALGDDHVAAIAATTVQIATRRGALACGRHHLEEPLPMGKRAFSSPYFPTPGSRKQTSRPKTSRKVSTVGASSRATRQIRRMRRFMGHASESGEWEIPTQVDQAAAGVKPLLAIPGPGTAAHRRPGAPPPCLRTRAVPFGPRPIGPKSNRQPGCSRVPSNALASARLDSRRGRVDTAA